MSPPPIPLLLILLLLADSPHLANSHRDDLKAACRATRHPSLCIHSLSSLSHPTARRSPQWWARAAVSVTLAETKQTSRYLAGVRHKARAGAALADCYESLGDAVGQLRDSLRELKRLGRRTFGWQMGDVETWVSAALTNEDTCLDGLRGSRGPVVRVIQAKVLNATYYTSNALALVNRLAASGGRA